MTTLQIADGHVLRPDMVVEDADVLVDSDAGTILDVGETTAGEEVLDASGGLVIPGLVNAHTHVAMTLLRGYADDKPLDAWLREDIWPVEAQLEAGDIAAGAALGIAEMIRSGTTAFADMYFEVPDIAKVVEQAGLRALLGYGSISAGRDHETAESEMLTGLSVARDLDGYADGRVQTAFMPHSLTTVDKQYLREFVPRARADDIPLHFHANETVEEVRPIVEEYGQRPLEYADDVGMLDSDDFFAHGVHLDETEIDLVAERGTGVVHCPASNMKLASGMAPVQRMLDAGVTVGLGTDGAASNNDLDMFDEMRDAAMLGKLQTDDASAVSAETVVRMATENGAAILGLDSGRIEAGANADLAVVDLEKPHLTPAHDLVSHLAYAVRGSDVRHTVCDGSVLMRDREIQTLDEATVRQRAQDRADDLVARAQEA